MKGIQDLTHRADLTIEEISYVKDYCKENDIKLVIGMNIGKNGICYYIQSMELQINKNK